MREADGNLRKFNERRQLSRRRLDMLLFFFSSRRRHTRFDCDWSSDVCSSDLFHNSPLAPTNVRTIVINPSNTREVLFVDGGLNLAAMKLVAELGFQTGKDQSFADRKSVV